MVIKILLLFTLCPAFTSAGLKQKPSSAQLAGLDEGKISANREKMSQLRFGVISGCKQGSINSSLATRKGYVKQ